MTATIDPERSGEDGNTVSSSPSISTKKQGSLAYRYCFTLNNYTQTDIDLIVPKLQELCKKYIFQEEIGEEGTSHLQGAIWLITKKRITALKKINAQAHWEVMRNETASIAYCQKKDTRKPDGMIWRKGFAKPLKDPLEDKTLYDFQKEIIELVQQEPNDRDIYWYWDAQGCKGKTTLAKHICIHYNAIYVQGNAKDIKFGISDRIEKTGEVDIVIVGLPRTREGFVSYDALESVKDGIFYNGKYKSGMCMFNPPHIIVLANFAPEKSKLSKDRWVVKCLDDFDYCE